MVGDRSGTGARDAPNVLLVTLDQLRADVVHGSQVATPSLDALRSESVTFLRHFTQAAPCSPGRAALYTGTYQMTNRVVANGTPLDDKFDNVARLARRVGYDPVLFGYTDQGVDPRMIPSDDDPRLDTYEGVLPGFRAICHLRESDRSEWHTWLRERGYEPGTTWEAALSSEPTRPAGVSQSAFLTEQVIAWLEGATEPWFVHLSYLRPHPPYAAAGEYSSRYDPEEAGGWIDATTSPHPLHAVALELEVSAAPRAPSDLRALRAQYFGMVTEVDAQLGRVLESLRSSGELERTIVIVTSDHGEQLGDHGLIQKLGFFPQSYAIPCVIRAPGLIETQGSEVEAFTEAVDIFPTLAELLGAPIPSQVDGRSLLGFLEGEHPSSWRDAVHWEWDWRFAFLPAGPSSERDEQLAAYNLAVLCDETGAYVHFGDGTSLCFDLRVDPTWRTPCTDPELELSMAKRMLTWRQRTLDHTLTDMLLSPTRRGRWPAVEPGATAVGFSS